MHKISKTFVSENCKAKFPSTTLNFSMVKIGDAFLETFVVVVVVVVCMYKCLHTL